MDLSRLTLPLSATRNTWNGWKAGLGLQGFQRGLRFKLLFLVVLVSLVSVLTSTSLLYSFQRRQLIENTQAMAATLSSMVAVNLQHAMVTGDWEMVNAIVQAAATNHSVDSLRIVNPQGVVSASSRPVELGMQLDRAEPVCQACHAGGAPDGSRAALMRAHLDRQALLHVDIIHNQPECQACHRPEQKVLGLLMIETPLAEVNRQLTAGFWRTTLSALGSLALLIGLIVPALNRWVIQPVGALSKGIAEVSAGNWDHPVRVDNQDELGKLANSFDRMQQQLKNSYSQLERREQEALALYALGTKVSGSLDLNAVLQAVAEAACELLAAGCGLVGLLEESDQEIVVRAAAGAWGSELKGVRLPVAERPAMRNLAAGQPVLSESTASCQPVLYQAGLLAAQEEVSSLAVPLRRGECFLGLIEVQARLPRRFLNQDAHLLMRLAHHVVVSIENARLYRQLRYLAILEERDRLAREMHDHLAQTLGYLNVRAAMTGDLFSTGRLEQAQESLQELKKATSLVYTDVREAIFNLRTSIPPQAGLFQTLRDYLADYRAYYGVDASLESESEDPELLPEVASQLLCIVQEALTNVRKHAGASRVWIHCKGEGAQLVVTIQDDGRGFHPDLVPAAGRPSFGLLIMRERAESVGGSLELVSQPGQGTQVIVRVPAILEE